jgi:hypothetical protein
VTSSVWRKQRIAANEHSFREINDRLAAELRQVRHLPEYVDFVCECGSRSCDARMTLTLEEYERVRADSETFAVLPGHVFPDVEVVLHGNERFQVLRKTEDPESG